MRTITLLMVIIAMIFAVAAITAAGASAGKIAHPVSEH